VTQPPAPEENPEPALPPAAPRPTLLHVMLVLLGISLGLHAWTLSTLHRTRALAHQQITLLTEQIQLVQDDVLTSNLRITHDVPVRARVPVREQILVPINTTVSIQDTVQLNGAGVEITLPLALDVPIATTVPVSIDETLDISTTVELDMHLPVSVPVRDTTLTEYLDNLHRALLELDRELGAS
jgi:hypothetical protein